MDATRVNLTGGWNIIWGAISGALGGVGGALTVLGTLIVVVGFVSWLWQKRRGTGGGQGHSGLVVDDADRRPAGHPGGGAADPADRGGHRAERRHHAMEQGQRMTVPTCYSLTGLTRDAGSNRRVIVQGFDLPFRGVLVAAAAFAVGLLPTIAAVLLVGSWGLLVMAAVQMAVFQLVERRTRGGLHLRTYRALLDRRSGGRAVGRFRCCGVTVNPAPSVFRTVTSASVPGSAGGADTEPRDVLDAVEPLPGIAPPVALTFAAVQLIPSRRRVVAALLGVVAALLVTVARPAAANTVSAPAHQVADRVSSPADDGCGGADGSGTLAGSDSNLAINRWADVSDTFHDRLDGDLWNDVIEKIQRRAVYSTMLSTGNSMWQASSNLVSFATRFCLLDTLGADADRVAAAIGGAFLGDGGPLLAAIMAAGLAVALWRQARGRGPGAWRGLARSGVLIALMAVMVTGASRTTTVTAPEDGSTATDFGTGSPGWVATRINAVIAALASAPAKAIADQGSIQEQTQDPGDPLSCAAFTANMRANYQDLYLGGPANLGASVPLVMSQMWQNTGLMVWVNSQFGAGNPYGPRVFCHVLENRLNTTRWLVSNTEVPRRTDGFGPRQGTGNGTMLGLLLDANRSGVPGVNGDAPAWDFRGDDVVEDAAVIGWAACRWDGDWSVDPAWATVDSGGDSGGGDGYDSGDSGDPVSVDDCLAWWSDPDTDITDLAMNFEDNPGHIRAATGGAPAVGNFLTNWHGNDNSAAFALAFAFDLSSLIMLLVFGGIALGIIVAKVAMVVMIALLIVAMVASLWIGPGSTRLAAYAKFYVGLAVFTFAISAIFALLNLITGFLVAAGARQFGPGSILAVLWSGFAPVTAVVVLHLLFKHVLRVPSPFKPSGALAYAGAIAGIGAAAGAGFDRLLSRAGSQRRTAGAAGRRWRPADTAERRPRQGIQCRVDADAAAGAQAARCREIRCTAARADRRGGVQRSGHCTPGSTCHRTD